MLGVPHQEKVKCFQLFKTFKAQRELKMGKKIKCLKTNNGEEFYKQNFDAFCSKKDIQ